MILVSSLKKMFIDKLKTTGSMDAAMTKALWMAYKQGYQDALQAESDSKAKATKR